MTIASAALSALVAAVTIRSSCATDLCLDAAPSRTRWTSEAPEESSAEPKPAESAYTASGDACPKREGRCGPRPAGAGCTVAITAPAPRPAAATRPGYAARRWWRRAGPSMYTAVPADADDGSAAIPPPPPSDHGAPNLRASSANTLVRPRTPIRIALPPAAASTAKVLLSVKAEELRAANCPSYLHES